MQEENKVKRSFRKNMKAELKKVVWPTGKQVIKSTFATISFVLLISVILVALNYSFSFLNDKWFDLVLHKVETSGDAPSGNITNSGEAVLSGEKENTEIASGEDDVSVDSGDANTITE